jgi:alkanesulfonate monooxygenase SsuD/methylene tetrahydromethanopterin reductase-like flavin-dependent oxidoreductase (luciferase family)
VFRTTSWIDALTALSAVAAITSKIKLCTSILNIVVRNPVVCAKALTGIDILSSGRLFAGVGPGSYKGDYDVCGIVFEERWKDSMKHYKFDDAIRFDSWIVMPGHQATLICTALHWTPSR